MQHTLIAGIPDTVPLTLPRLPLRMDTPTSLQSSADDLCSCSVTNVWFAQAVQVTTNAMAASTRYDGMQVCYCS